MDIPAFSLSIDDIHRAAEIISGQVVRTPLIRAPKLSDLTGAEVYVKYENLQFTNSFKDRGALVKLLSLTDAEQNRGVIAMSAGNHAQAVAYHARRLGIPAKIVMPRPTPFIKVGNTEALGATVVLSGETLTEAKQTVDEIASEEGLTIVHPYDDPLIIAGQGTVGLEVLTDQPQLDVLLIPIGGGGLIAGSALVASHHESPVDVVGVEAELYPSMFAAVKNETLQCGGQTLAEGIAVKTAGVHTTPIVSALVRDIVLVDEPMIESAICTYLTTQKTMAEGAGAVPLAALLADRERFRGKKIALYLSGGNIDPRILSSIMVRGLEREKKIISFRTTIADQPGVLGQIATILGDAGANILEVSHRRTFLDVPAKGASLDMMIEVKDASHGDKTLAGLRAQGFTVQILHGQGGFEPGHR